MFGIGVLLAGTIAYVYAGTQLGQFSGAVLVAHEGKILLRKGYGYANLEHLAPNTPQTRFEIASLTKAFTAFAVHDLARNGKLRLDEPACNYVEACPEAWKPITIAHLWYYRVIRQLGPSRTSAFMNLMPFAVIGLSRLLVGEAVHAYHLVGALLVIAGVLLTTSR